MLHFPSQLVAHICRAQTSTMAHMNGSQEHALQLCANTLVLRPRFAEIGCSLVRCRPFTSTVCSAHSNRMPTTTMRSAQSSLAMERRGGGLVTAWTKASARVSTVGAVCRTQSLSSNWQMGWKLMQRYPLHPFRNSLHSHDDLAVHDALVFFRMGDQPIIMTCRRSYPDRRRLCRLSFVSFAF